MLLDLALCMLKILILGNTQYFSYIDITVRSSETIILTGMLGSGTKLMYGHPVDINKHACIPYSCGCVPIPT